MQISTIKLLFILPLISFSVMASEPEVNNIHVYDKVIIEQVGTQSDSGAAANNILIADKVRKTSEELLKEAKLGNIPVPFKAGKSIWTINENLPLSEMECTMNYADLCTPGKVELYDGSCFKPCIAYGPEFIDYNEANGLIYFSASSASIGTGGGPFFFFVGDVKNKSIQYIGSAGGPIRAKLSPNGRYLMLYDNGPIYIYDSLAHKFFTAVEYQDDKTGYAHHLTDIKWIDNNRFSYSDQIPKFKNQTMNKTYTLAE